MKIIKTMKTANTNLLKQAFILMADMAIVAIAFVVSIYVIFGTLDITPYQMEFAIALGIYLVMFWVFHTFFMVVKYLGEKDYLNTLFASVGALTCLLALQAFVEGFDLPFKIIVLSSLISLISMLFFRWFMKTFHPFIIKYKRTKARTVIFGAGKMGQIVLELSFQQGEAMKVVAFFDDDLSLHNRRSNGVKIYDPERYFEEIIQKKKVDQLVFAIQNLSNKRKKFIVDKCLKSQIKVLTVPSYKEWINGKLSPTQLKNIRFEELLNREEIFLNRRRISERLSGKTILVTGAAGSIGSEIVRQLVSFLPRKVIVLDQSETALVDLGLELKEKFGFSHYQELIADVTDNNMMESIFKYYKPELVYHAAAYKHVPILESHPYEALKTNVLGTRVLAQISCQYEVQRFIMISTDKAVNPSSIMGVSKRIAELIVQSLDNKSGKTNFIITRFGNVLGSNGSVVPRFARQIQEGGPITVTHPDVERYFMTIHEACQLVLEASAMGNGGEVYTFDMGEPVKIKDLALKMIRLSGNIPDKDIEIVYTGLRAGEKLYEELLNNDENVLKTHHPKIRIAKKQNYDFNFIDDRIDFISNHLDRFLPVDIIDLMRSLVPEYKRSNTNYYLEELI